VPEKNVPFTLVLDFVKQKLEWALRFRILTKKCAAVLYEKLEKTDERQLFALSENLTVCFFRRWSE
jgi:hypothetical protein